MNFTDAYTDALLFANDLKTMHWMAQGEHFDFIHNKAQEYYEKALADADWFAEEAITQGQQAFNPSDVKSFIQNEYNPVKAEGVDLNAFIATLKSIAKVYMDTLYKLSDDDSLENRQRSYVDDMLNYWNKEISYKLEMMSSTPGATGQEDIEADDMATDSGETPVEGEDTDVNDDTSLDGNPTVFDTDTKPFESEAENESGYLDHEEGQDESAAPNTENDGEIPEEDDENKDIHESIDPIENPLDRMLDHKISRYHTDSNVFFE